MKSLFFIIIIGLHLSDSIAQVTPNDIVINLAYELGAISEICRGIAIRPKIVMTAAECVDGILPTNFLVENLQYKLVSDVSAIIIHPEYTKCNGSNNFAILIVENFITGEDTVACLPDEIFLHNIHSYHCSEKLITTKLSTRFSSDKSQCFFLPHLYPFKTISRQICELSDKESPNILKNREVQMLICKSHTTNSRCPAYYFAHDSSIKICDLYGEKFPNIFIQQTNFVYYVAPWIQDEIQKYVNSVPEISASILITLIACIVTRFSML